MSSIEKKVLSKIQGYGRGYAFSSSDFIKQFPSDSVDKALSLLAAKKKIRRIARGLYDYPKYSELLAQELSPDIEQVAYALARKFNWKIEISGNSALNILGLSTQIPGIYLYLSSGPNRTYTLCNQVTLEFKKAALKNIGFKYKESSLIVQALKELGKENINQEIIDTIRKNIDKKMYTKILDDTKVTITWIYETIKQICKES